MPGSLSGSRAISSVPIPSASNAAIMRAERASRPTAVA